MSATIRTASVALIALFAAASQACWAAEPFVGTGIDPNEFRPGHPASPRWIIVRDGQEHPAVQVTRAARTQGIDPNTFTVQPPASVRWTLSTEPPALIAGALR